MKTIYKNGAVYTGKLPLVEAFAVEDGKFVFAGSSAEADALAAAGDKVVDLGGKFVCSGFNDSHMHLLNYGSSLLKAQLAAHTESLEDMLACLDTFQKEHPRKDGAWLMGRGWNQDYFTDVNRMPNRYDLDRVSTEVPICATRACGHSPRSQQQSAGTPRRHRRYPRSRRAERSVWKTVSRTEDSSTMQWNRFTTAFRCRSKEEIKDMIRSACKALNSYGVTSSQSDDYCVYRAVPWQTVNEAYKELEESGELTVRVYEQSNFTDLESLKGFVEAGNVTGIGTDRFKIGPLKMLGDGALGARTAFLSRPYADDPSTCGIPVFTQETMDEMIGYANAHGMQAAVHTIGDACLDRVLSAYEKALLKNPREDHRHGIVHCQITRADQLEKIAKMHLHVYAQSIFLDYDNHIVEERVGKELASTSYSWKTLMNNGVSVSNGTDCPVELPDAPRLHAVRCQKNNAARPRRPVPAGSEIHRTGSTRQLHNPQRRGKFRGERERPDRRRHDGRLRRTGSESV